MITSKKTAVTTLLAGTGLVVAICAVYSNSLRVPFLLDDHATVLTNPSITRLWPLSAVLLPPAEMYTAGRPLLNLSFALNHAISGTSVLGYHLTNLAIHAAAALALFGILRRTLAGERLRDRFGSFAGFFAFAVAALWALHPLQTVSVTYISQRAESLMGLFYLLTLYSFIRGAEQGSTRWLIASTAICTLGMATKEVMVTAPLLVFLYDWQFLAGTARGAWQQRWRWHLALGGTWLVLGGLMIGSNLGRRAVGLGHDLSRFDYAQLECRALAHYLRVALWPDRLIFDHGPDLVRPTVGEVMGKGGLILGLLGLALFGLWRGRVWGFLGCVFFLLLAPTSSVVPVAGQPIAENRMYLPLAPVLLAAAGGLHRIFERRSQAFLGGALILFGVIAHARNADFHTDIGIWTDTTAKQPTNGRAWYFLSIAQAAAGHPNKAIEALASALKHRPNDAVMHNNLGAALFGVGRFDEARPHFERAIQLHPTYAESYYNLGALLYQTRQYTASRQAFEATLRLKPDSVEGENYAGLCALALGDVPAAIRHFQRALTLAPQHQAAQANLQHALSLRR